MILGVAQPASSPSPCPHIRLRVPLVRQPTVRASPATGSTSLAASTIPVGVADLAVWAAAHRARPATLVVGGLRFALSWRMSAEGHYYTHRMQGAWNNAKPVYRCRHSSTDTELKPGAPKTVCVSAASRSPTTTSRTRSQRRRAKQGQSPSRSASAGHRAALAEFSQIGGT
jgi:hypothetical protein